LEVLPQMIGNLENLQELDVEDNNLDSIPESINNLINLKSLFIDNNKNLKRPESLELEFCDVK
jgi:Leucine-rich repeat (LRR) protein